MRERKNDDDDDDYNKTHHVYDDPLKLVEELRRDRQLTRTRPDSKKVQNVDTTTKDAKKRPKSKFGFKSKAKSKKSRSKQYELSPNETSTVSDEPSTSGVQDNHEELTSSYVNDGFKTETEDRENDLTVNVLLSKESKKAGTPANITVKNVDLEQSSIAGATTGESVSSTSTSSPTHSKELGEQTSKVRPTSTRPTPKKRSNISSKTATCGATTGPVPSPSSTSSPTHSKELKKAKPSSTRPKPKKRTTITKTSTSPSSLRKVEIDKPESQSQSDVTRSRISERVSSPDTETSTSLSAQNISKTGITAPPPSASTTASDQPQIIPVASTRHGTKTSKTNTSTSTASKTKKSPTHAKQKHVIKAPIVPVIKLEGPSEDSKESPKRTQPNEAEISDKTGVQPEDVAVEVHYKADQSSSDHLKPSTSGIKTKKPTPTSSLLSPYQGTPSPSPSRTKKESPYAEITPRQDPNKTSGPVSPPEPPPRTSSEVKRTSSPSIIVTSSDGVSSDIETGVETNLERDHLAVTSSSSISSKTIEILFRRQKRKRVFLLLVTLFLFFLLVGVVGVGIFLSSLARDTEEVAETINEPDGNT